MPLCLVYIPIPNLKEARELAKMLLEKKLVACVNIVPSTSLYLWEGAIREEAEQILLAKTTEKNFEKIVREVEKLHSSELPAILRVPFDSSSRFASWVQKSVC